jgi:hypothetical protein
MSILRKIRRNAEDHREQRALDRALANAPTQSARHELEMLRSLGR